MKVKLKKFRCWGCRYVLAYDPDDMAYCCPVCGVLGYDPTDHQCKSCGSVALASEITGVAMRLYCPCGRVHTVSQPLTTSV